MTFPFFTIGHSNRTIKTFSSLLREAQVELLIDIRRFPMSRANPQFNTRPLMDALAPYQISYEYIASLGGRRNKSETVPANVNGYWKNHSFHNYADYALSERFHAGFRELLEDGQRSRSAIMCSEAVWWRCHRRIVADYLLAAGETVYHILGENHIEVAQLTPGAVIMPDKSVVYPINGVVTLTGLQLPA
ncbi:DUF488 domain-containing protein (plasmid) [Brucella pseudintermedia]|uniref:DUF488 domain-containing protein n=1 Tax=Brucella pseudintermedia TaxID=370111 RepID=UPI002AC99379|nr:DUF488 domain-containing protein [Brucella pseudintermedia]WPM82985.1 DUF488 domain-containing protein [Brucella pseudintermedia]